MKRRHFLAKAALAAGGTGLVPNCLTAAGPPPFAFGDSDLGNQWLMRWEKNILADARNRYCDRESGEEIGWLVSPFLNGFHDGYQATREVKWVEHLADWADSWIRRGVKEPDGYIG